MSAMRKEALAIGKDTSKSASEAAAAMGELTRAGVSVKDAVGGVARTTVQLAEATGASVSDMAGLLSNSLNTFKLQASDAGRVADTLAKSVNASSIEIGDMGFALQQAGAVAKLAGLSLEDTTTAIGILGNNALKGSDAGTSLKTMLTSLVAPSKDAKAELQRIGVAVFDASGKTLPFTQILGSLQQALAGATEKQKAATLETIFGSDAIRAASILVAEGTEGWQKFQETQASMNGVAEMSKERLNTLNGAVEQLKGSLETMAIEGGTKAIPMLTLLAETANKATFALQSDIGKSFTAQLIETFTHAGALTTALDLGSGAVDRFKGSSDQAVGSIRKMTEEEALAEQKFREGVAAKHKAADMTAEYAAQARDAAVAGMPFAQTLTEIEKAAKKSGDRTGEFVKQLQELAGQMTETEHAAKPQISALDSVASSMKAVASSTDPAIIAEWTGRAKEMAGSAGLSAEQTDKLNAQIDLVAKGGPNATKATEDLGKMIDGLQAPLKNTVAANRDYLKATADSLESTQTMGRGIDDLKQTMIDFVGVFALQSGRVPPIAAQMSQDVLQAWAIAEQAKGLGNSAAAGFAAGILASASLAAEAARIVGIGATVALKESIRAESPSKETEETGVDMSSGFAIGIRKGAQMVREAAASIGIEATDALEETVATSAPKLVSGWQKAAAASRRELTQVGEEMGETVSEGTVIGYVGAMRANQMKWGAEVRAAIQGSNLVAVPAAAEAGDAIGRAEAEAYAAWVEVIRAEHMQVVEAFNATQRMAAEAAKQAANLHALATTPAGKWPGEKPPAVVGAGGGFDVWKAAEWQNLATAAGIMAAGGGRGGFLYGQGVGSNALPIGTGSDTAPLATLAAKQDETNELLAIIAQLLGVSVEQLKQMGFGGDSRMGQLIEGRMPAVLR